MSSKVSAEQEPRQSETQRKNQTNCAQSNLSPKFFLLYITENRKQKTAKFPRDDKILDLRCGNDPSAGSPTETLLRLHLPLNDKV
jgi:hypothetical protein